MKKVDQLPKDLDGFLKRLKTNLSKAQQETAKKIEEDVKANMNVAGGRYIESIKTSDTREEEGRIHTDIYTDLKSKDGYLIGRMIENGTGIYALEPHIGHTKTFIESEYRYWYVPVEDVDRPLGRIIVIDGKEFYIAKAQKPRPHWKPAGDMNQDIYKENISKAVKESL